MSATYIGYNVHPDHKDAKKDQAACVALSLGEFIERSLPIDESTDPPSIRPRRITPETVFVGGQRQGENQWVGTLASILRGEPDRRYYRDEGESDPVIVAPKRAISALLHHAGTGRLTLTPRHLATLAMLREFDR